MPTEPTIYPEDWAMAQEIWYETGSFEHGVFWLFFGLLILVQTFLRVFGIDD